MLTFHPGEWYSEYYRDAGHAPDRYAYARYVKALDRAPVSEGMNVLDIGCIFGTLFRTLRERQISCTYIGSDIVDRCMTGLADEEEAGYFQCDITKGLELPDEWADRVFCLEVIEHVREPLAALEEIQRLLKPDGVGVISVPNPYFWDTILANIMRRRSRSGHIHAWTWQEMACILDFAGLELLMTARTYNIIPLTWKGQRKGRFIFGRPWFSFLSHNIQYVVRKAKS